MDETIKPNAEIMSENGSSSEINKDLSGEDLFPNPSGSVLNDQEIRELDLLVNPETKTVVMQKTLTIPIKWPYRLDFFRVHPDPSWIMTVATIEWEHRHYVLTPELYQRYELEAEIKKLVPAIAVSGRLFLWPIKVNLYGRFNPKADTADKAIKLARREWIRIASNRHLGDYSVATAKGLPEPVWPEDIRSKEDLYRIALSNVAITSPDHHVIRSIEGEMVYSEEYLDS